MNKVAFITGSSRGIGRAIACELAHQGYAVGINYIQSADKAAELVAELTAQGCRAMAVQADVADRTAITKAIRTVEAAFGPVTLLVSNAGIADQLLFQDVTDEFWHRIFAVNVDGAYHAIQAVLPNMIREKKGCIIIISSIWGLRGGSCEVAYSATKAALIGLTRSLAREVAPSGVRVNCVAPGAIDTDMAQVLGDEVLQMVAEETPVGRLGAVEDIATAVAFLADDRASFITGQVITSDGGFSV